MQAFDLVVRKLIDDEGQRYGEFAARIRSDLEQAGQRDDLRAIHAAVTNELERIERVAAAYRALAREHRRSAEAGAAAFLA